MMVGIVSAFVTVIISYLMAGLLYWAVLFLLFLLVLWVVEYLSMRARGRTISREFLEFSRRRPVVAGLLMAITLAAIGWIVAHLFTGV